MIYHHGGFPFIIDFIRDISSIATCMRNSCTRIFGFNKLFNFQLSSPQQNTLAYQYPTTWDMSVTSLSQNRKMLCARLFWGCSLDKYAHVYVNMNPWMHTVVMCTPPGHNLSIPMGAVAVNMHTCRHSYILWWRGASSLVVMNLVAEVCVMWFARV